jgi:hypothetical protein
MGATVAEYLSTTGDDLLQCRRAEQPLDGPKFNPQRVNGLAPTSLGEAASPSESELVAVHLHPRVHHFV